MSPAVVLILLVLSPSIHACSGRVLRVEAKYSHTLFDVSSKGFRLAKLTDSSVPTIPSPGGVVPVDTIHGCASATYGKPRSSEKQTKDADGKRSRVLSAGAVQNPSLVKVSWRVPRDGTREHPRFDVDYVGPRTHPPSHN